MVGRSRRIIEKNITPRSAACPLHRTVRTKTTMSNGFETCDKHTYLFATETKDCPYCRIEELEQQLDRYQGGIEVEGVISEFGDILLPEPTPIDIGKRVRVHVKEVE